MHDDLPATPANTPESVARLADTLHQLDEAHRRYRVYTARVVDVSPTELSALTAINDTPGITPGALARDIVLSSGATTSVIDRLERSGHIFREKHPGDRRSLHLRLTEKGDDTMSMLNEAYRYVLSTSGTDDAITAVLPQLDRVTDALNSAAREPTGPE
jgi:DNA-binding MarR family transcriptional regulator